MAGDKPHDYGKQRLWGAIGWGLMTVISGYLIDLASVGELEKDYTPSFYLVVIILSINVLAVIKIKVINQLVFIKQILYFDQNLFFLSICSRLTIIKNRMN